MNFVDRIANFDLGSLSSAEKKRIALAGAGVVALLGFAWWLSTLSKDEGDRDYGIEIDELCVNARVTNPEKLRRTLEDLYDAQVEAGVVDPLAMTTVFFQKVAPKCQVYPKTARSPKEAEFFLVVFVAFLEQLEGDALITDDEGGARMLEAMAWAMRSGWKPEREIGPLLPGGEA